MLQLKHLRLIRDLTGCEPKEIKAIKFGIEVQYTTATALILAAQTVPVDAAALLVLRTHAYMLNADETATDYAVRRVVPPGVALWRLGTRTETTGYTIADLIQTDPTAFPNLLLDEDEFLFFPPAFNALLQFTPTDAAPAAGAWFIRATCYGYFVPPLVVDKLATAQNWINPQNFT